MKKTVTTLAVLAAVSTASQAALLVGYNTVNGATVAATDIHANVDGIQISRGGGISQASGGDYNSNGWNDSTNATESATNGDFLEFGITVDAGFNLENLSVGFFGDRSNTGPTSIEVFYSTDNFSNQTSLLGATDVGATGSIQDTSAASETLNGTVGIRIYGYGASGGTGTFDIEDTEYDSTYGLVINGDIRAVPEPSSSALVGLGGLALLLRRRR